MPKTDKLSDTETHPVDPYPARSLVYLDWWHFDLQILFDWHFPEVGISAIVNRYHISAHLGLLVFKCYVSFYFPSRKDGG